jgi:hypothetical protein
MWLSLRFISQARSIRRCRAGFRSILWCRFAGNKAIFLGQLNGSSRSRWLLAVGLVARDAFVLFTRF